MCVRRRAHSLPLLANIKNTAEICLNCEREENLVAKAHAVPTSWCFTILLINACTFYRKSDHFLPVEMGLWRFLKTSNYLALLQQKLYRAQYCNLNQTLSKLVSNYHSKFRWGKHPNGTLLYRHPKHHKNLLSPSFSPAIPRVVLLKFLISSALFFL